MVATVGLAFSPVASAKGPKGPTIVDVAIAINTDGPFAGRFDTLSGAGKLTVFAPTDDAFAALGLTPDNVGTLPTSFLMQVLVHRVALGERTAANVVPAERIRRLGGGFLYKESGSTTLADNLGRNANSIVTDVKAANGVIHAVDAIVLPAAP